jgi:hypothetical protein
VAERSKYHGQRAEQFEEPRDHLARDLGDMLSKAEPVGIIIPGSPEGELPTIETTGRAKTLLPSNTVYST